MQIKKFAQSDRYGNSLSIEFEVPPIQNEIPKFEDYFNHPGEPKGTDTVPAWLTPGERVMNAEAERMYGPQLEAMNEQGRAIQRAQGGTIPEYAAGGCKVKYAAKGSKASCDCPECSRTVYAAKGDLIPYPEIPTQPGTLNTEIPTPYDDYTINARRLLVDQEGYKTSPYQDHLGNWTVGAGHKIVDKDTLAKLNAGETVNYQPEQLMDFFEKDYGTALKGAQQNFKDFQSYPDELQHALLSMNYQLGAEGTSKFEKMRKALEEKDWEKAAYEAGNSKWAKQTPVRASYLQSQIRKMKDAPLVTEMDIPMSDSDAPILGANGEQYNIDTLTASTQSPTVPLPGSKPEKEQSFWEWLTTPQEQTLGRTIDDALGIPVTNQNAGIPKDEGRSQLPVPQPTPAMRAITEDREGVPHPLEGKSFIERITTPRDEYITVTPPEEKAAQQAQASLEDRTKALTDLVNETENDEPITLGLTKDEALAKVKQVDARTLDDDIGIQDQTTSDEERSFYNQAKTWLNQQTGDFNVGNLLADAASSITGFIGDSGLLDSKELSRAAIMYLGSRAFGYDHGGSAEWAAKNYLKRIDAKDKQKEAYAKAALGKYTTKSIEEFRKSGKLSDLKPINATKYSKDFKVFNINGQKVNGYWDETSQLYYARTLKGDVPLPANAQVFKEDTSVEDFSKWKKDLKSDLNAEIDNYFPAGEKPERFPTGGVLANETARFFDSKGYNIKDAAVLAQMNSVAYIALGNMAKYAEGNEDKQVRIEPFLTQAMAESAVGSDYNIFLIDETETDINEQQYVDVKKINRAMNSIESIASASTNNSVEARVKQEELLTKAVMVWRNMDSDQKSKYRPNSDENGFYVFLDSIVGDNKLSAEEQALLDKR